MIINAENLKKARKEAKLSQEMLSELLGVSRQTIISYEKGGEIPETKLNRIKQIFNEMSNNLHIDVKEIELNSKESLLKDNIASVDTSNPIYEVIPVPEDDYMVVEFEDLEAAAGKLGGNDITVLPERKKRLVPREYAKGSYLVVKVYGDSMNDQTYRSILNGDEILIKQYFDFIENLPIRNKLFVIVTDDGSRVVKQIKEVDKKNKKIICHSFNPIWEDYPVYFDQITQIFTVEKKVKSNIFF